MNNFYGSTEFTIGLNCLFVVLIGAAFWMAWTGVKQGKRNNYVEYAPSLMTSLGLFGTFLGIFIGLLGFDTQQIDGSIGQLLNGLKTAFFTSIFGMLMAIVFKVLQTRVLDQRKATEDPVDPDEVGPKEIHAVLKKQYQALDLIVLAIGGNNERSLVGQVQMMRTDITDFRASATRQQEAFEEKLWGQLNSFAEMLSKSATQQVIEALKQVIVEFNEKLTEQFGENFKRLDESVKKLVDWQQGYMVQLDGMIKQYQLGVQAIDSTKVAVQEIRVETSKIPVNMEALGEVMHVNQHQIAELSRHLDVFVAMRDQAVIAVPHIQQKLEEVGQQLRDGAQQVNTVLIQGSEQFQHSVLQTNQSMVKSANEMAGQSEHISKELSDALELLGLNTERIRTGVTATISTAMESLEEHSKRSTTSAADAVSQMLASVQQGIDATNQAYAQHTERSLGGIEKHVKDMVSRTNDGVNEQLRQFDEAMARQLNKALTDLASALSSIHRHLVDDVYRGKSQQAERARVNS